MTPAAAHPVVESTRAPARIWASHLLCFVLPAACVAFLVTAPHPWTTSLAWLLVLVVSVFVDVWSGPEQRQPPAPLAAWPFDAVLYVLVALQLVITALLVRMVVVGGFWRADTFVAYLLVGVNSGYSAIVVAHELIHRRERHFQWLGRLLLCTVLYEHFFTEHIRGHHVRVGTAEDPATAQFGETFHHFFFHTVPAQFRSAWRLEAKRLQAIDLPWWHPRLLVRSRVAHGLALEWALALGILAAFGVGPFAMFVLQALVAIELLEAVNYMEHWGLLRDGRKVATVDSWDTDSAFTLYTLVGLSRHADHHAHPARPYQALRFFDDSPKLPAGYFGTVALLLTWNSRFRELMTAELRRRRLGPFAA